MPRKCCVPMCRSNYASSNEGYITTFRFPSDDCLRQKWIQCIPRDNWQPSKDAVVCAKHFSSGCFSSGYSFIDEQGNVAFFPSKRNELLPDACPSIFPGLPSYFSKDTPKRRDPEERRLELENRVKRARHSLEEAARQEDLVGTFDNFRQLITKKIDDTKWQLSSGDDCVCIFRLDFNNLPNVIQLIKVDQNLRVTIYLRGYLLAVTDVGWPFLRDGTLKNWSQLTDYLHSSLDRLPEVSQVTLETHFIDVIDQICEKYLHSNENHEAVSQLKFIREQFELMVKKRKSYSKDTLILAFMLHCQSAAAYNSLRESGCLILPHPKHLQRLAAGFNISANSEDDNIHFLRVMTENITGVEKFVILSLDEIYINPTFEYKNGRLIGQATNNCNEIARTIQAFMVHSAFGSFKEVVSLTPVKSLKGDYLLDLTMEVLNFVQSHGLIVICVICDNSRVNKSMMNGLCTLLNSESKYYVNNPKYSNLKIFLMYDPVHIFKNIRNNWLNQTDPEKSFLFPDFDNFNILRKASFSCLRMLYDRHSHSSNIVANAHKLSYKSVYPNSLERQKVQLVENIFHDTTVAALKVSKLDNGFTVPFLQIVSKWWHIINVKSAVKGVCKREVNQLPFTSGDDGRIEFLYKFCNWVKYWVNLNLSSGCLTHDTSAALIQTTTALIHVIKFSFCSIKPKYLLTGKFQTDNLERRFGRYRQLSGCAYNVSALQVLESEKKLRMKSVLNLHSSRFGKVKFIPTILQQDCDVEETDSSELTEINCDILESLLSLNVCEGNFDMSGLIYISGYAVRNLSKRIACNSCLENMCGTICNDPYFEELQRGGLVVPSEKVIDLCITAVGIFNILVSSQVKEEFLSHSDHQGVLIKLTKSYVELDGSQEFWLSTNLCNHDNTILMDKLLRTFSNILLNNYRLHVKQQIGTATPAKSRKLFTYNKV